MLCCVVTCCRFASETLWTDIHNHNGMVGPAFLAQRADYPTGEHSGIRLAHVGGVTWLGIHCAIGACFYTIYRLARQPCPPNHNHDPKGYYDRLAVPLLNIH